jgi:hypothetical protein
VLPQVMVRCTRCLDESPQLAAASNRFFRVGLLRLKVDLLNGNMEVNNAAVDASEPLQAN